MNIKIITIYDPIPNYGNRLQNYAVQYVMEKWGMKTTTISIENKVISREKRVKYYLQKLTGFRLPGDKNYWKYFCKKENTFLKFNKKYISTKNISSASDIGVSDYFVVGSDQVWNPTWFENNNIKKDIYLLTFANTDQKVCFSPSFGVDELPNEWKSWFKEQLSTFSKISVREDAGAKIVKDLVDIDATVLIDPTLMLKPVDWLNISKKPKKTDCTKPYILTYFLGGRSGRVNRDLKTFSKQIEAETYNLLDYNQPDVFVSGPSEFVYLLANAKLVLTDSFHACVFSFLFHKPFLVYEREGNEKKMFSRMNTLLTKFDLKRKFVDSGIDNDLLEANYENGFKQLEIERKKVSKFLKESMGLE